MRGEKGVREEGVRGEDRREREERREGARGEEGGSERRGRVINAFNGLHQW